MPFIEQLHLKYGKRGLHVLGISIDEDVVALKRFLSKHNPQYLTLHDRDKGFKEWGITVVPTVVLVKNSIVQGVFYYSDGATIESAVRKALE